MEMLLKELFAESSFFVSCFSKQKPQPTAWGIPVFSMKVIGRLDQETVRIVFNAGNKEAENTLSVEPHLLDTLIEQVSQLNSDIVVVDRREIAR